MGAHVAHAPIPSDVSIQEAHTSELRPFASVEESLPRRFGPFDLLRLIGKGGMARVYEGHRLGAMGLHTRAAVKVLHAELTSDPRFLRPFVREAELTSQISHPNILQIHEFNRVGERFFIAMEYVDGCDLGRLLHHLGGQPAPMPLCVVVDIACQVLRGLSWAHRARSREGKALELVHRDLKPANILLARSGLVKVADFGIAQSSASMYVTHTQTDLKGTLMYMSPEQVRQIPLDHRSDLFTVGMILFEMLAGEPLVTARSIRKVVGAILRVDMQEVANRLPPGAQVFVPILEAALQPELAWRYGSAQEMEDDLHALRALLPTGPSLERFVGAACQDIDLDADNYATRVTPVDSAVIPPFTPEDLDNFSAPPRALRVVPAVQDL